LFLSNKFSYLQAARLCEAFKEASAWRRCTMMRAKHLKQANRWGSASFASPIRVAQLWLITVAQSAHERLLSFCSGGLSLISPNNILFASFLKNDFLRTVRAFSASTMPLAPPL
jgi:hypothetical protein